MLRCMYCDWMLRTTLFSHHSPLREGYDFTVTHLEFLDFPKSSLCLHFLNFHEREHFIIYLQFKCLRHFFALREITLLQLINRGCKTALQMNKGRHEYGWSIAYSLISAWTHNLQLHNNVILLISKISLQGCLNTGVIGNRKSLSCRLSFPWSPVIDK